MKKETLIDNNFAPDFHYPVYFTENVFDHSSDLLCNVFNRLDEGRRHRVVAYVDSGLAAAQPSLVNDIREYAHTHAASFELATEPIIFPGGAAAKNEITLIKDIIFTLGNLHIDRQSFVLAIGGGSMLDAVGFGASILHRGVRLVRMPTTVLAQSDGGVGVKTGIDHHGQKNFLGTFAPPFAVINDIAMLSTLPKRERIAGLAEIAKVAIIRDSSLFTFLEENYEKLVAGEPDALRVAVERGAALHLHQITKGGDPFELGSARPLDFGHWAGHRLEILSGHAINQGEGVGVGMALDTIYAQLAGILDAKDSERIVSLIKKLQLPVYLPELERTRNDGTLELLAGLENFREHLGGLLCVTLPTEIGKTIEVNSMDESLIQKAIVKAREYK
ncbi:MAG: 3-dehydroquinate synthase [Lentisphaerae bacterium]|nr:3-dehydroquinate synthase [Lentisphaerota bacterium]